MRSEALWIVGGRIANAILLLLALRMMTTLLPPDAYGLLALLTAFQAFAGLILLNPSGQYLNRHTHQWHAEGSLDSRIKAYARYWLWVSVLTGVLAAVWFAQSQAGSGLSLAYCTGLAVAAAIYLFTLQGMDVSRLNMLGYRRESVTWQLTATASGLAFSSALSFFWPSALAWLAGQAVGAGLAHLGAWRVLRRAGKSEAEAKRYRARELLLQADFLRFALPLALVTSLLWLEGNGYRLILERAWSLSLLGLFALALSVPAQMTALLESIVTQLVYPYFFKALSGEASAPHHARIVSSMVNVLLPLYVLWGAFLLLSAPHVLRLLTDSRYHEAAQWVFVGVAAEIARLIGNAWQLVAQAEKNFAPTVLPFAVGAVGVLAGAGLSAMFAWQPGQFGHVLLAALYLKMALNVAAMRGRMPIHVSLRRLLPALAVLAVAVTASFMLPTRFDPVPALVYLLAVSAIVAVPVAIHLRTSPDVRFLFSHRLREGV
ncbi:MAG: hypothetical protein CVU17_11190 [Betaproteobacteria bacterium HGW-Betaproteobacteria-11]|nr:MAG: hypothetical protein CVU17_11190 [Betaproteobacteria bacterium HGW-Betaproteobacteria-11]